MAIAKTLLRAKTTIGISPEQVLNAINVDICKENDSLMFITFFLGILNIETGFLRYCNAGHNPPLVHNSDEDFHYFHERKAQPPIGIIPDIAYIGNSVLLLPGDIFFLYTDGITEAINIDEVQFSEEKLQKILKQNKRETVANMINKIKAEVDLHSAGTLQSDDITMLAIRYKT